MPTLQHPGGDALHERFTERQVGEVYQFMYRFLGDREEAETLTARTFFKARDAMRAAPLPAGGSTQQRADRLLCEAARDVLASELRARYHGAPESAARVEALMRADGPSGVDAGGAGALVYAQGVLARLPALERDLLTYRFLLNSPLESAAEVMGLSHNAALALQWAALAHAASIVASDHNVMPARPECDA